MTGSDRRGVLLTVIPVCALLACAGGSGSDGGAGGGMAAEDGGPRELPIDELCVKLSTAMCEWAERCGGFGTVESCVQGWVSSCLDSTAEFAGIVDAGRIRYDGAKAFECVSSYASRSCHDDPFQPSGPPCSELIVGLVPTGGTCGAAEPSCVPGDFCKVGATSCGGTCRPLIGVGQPAGPRDLCVAGAEPYGGICTQGLPRGSSCAPPVSGRTLPCAEGHCSSLIVDGGLMLVCATHDAQEGERCTDLAAAVSGCARWLECDQMTGRCAALVGVNGACSPTNGGARCNDGLWCNGSVATPTCQPRSDVGGPCAHDVDCKDNGACDGGLVRNPDGGRSILGTCLAPPGLHAPCVRFSCADGLTCDPQSDVCIQRRPNGAPCVSSTVCQSGLCNPREGGDGTCGRCPG